GKENRLRSPSASSSTLNKRGQQILEYSASRRVSVKNILKKEKKTPPQDNEKSWAGKQAAGFKEWLNFTLVGAEELPHGAGRDDELMEKRPSSELSTPLKAMVAVRREARHGTRAMQLFRSAGMREVCVAVADRARDG
ncbi:unnamed protein product, partial [Ascophyllum nodosum]